MVVRKERNYETRKFIQDTIFSQKTENSILVSQSSENSIFSREVTISTKVMFAENYKLKDEKET